VSREEITSMICCAAMMVVVSVNSVVIPTH
jgi:hypothetical protein